MAALVYPGQVIWEGTNVSEGRGTTMPFELFGAPFLEHQAMLDHLNPAVLQGAVLRPLQFEPVAGKWAAQSCSGFQIHVTDIDAFRPYRLSLALLQSCLLLYPEAFAYKKPPYEYEFERLPMDLIIGNRNLRQGLEQGVDVLELERSWQEELQGFEQHCQSVLLYE